MLVQIHPPRDQKKVKALAADMLINGWVGSPIVMDGTWGNGNAFTGTHRLEAYYSIQHDVNWTPELITWQDVAGEAGFTPEEVADLYEDSAESDFVVFFSELMPFAIQDKYGLDAH